MQGAALAEQRELLRWCIVQAYRDQALERLPVLWRLRDELDTLIGLVQA